MAKANVFRPGQAVPGRGRYTTEPLPPYSYVPGYSPHPVSNPAGHLYGKSPPSPAMLDPLVWRENSTYLYAIDLFNHGYYWEAHEAWESLWHVAGRRGLVADWLKALVKLAAVGVKLREGNATGVQRHARRTLDLMAGVCPRGAEFAGIDTTVVQEFLAHNSNPPKQIAPDPHKLLPLVLRPASD